MTRPSPPSSFLRRALDFLERDSVLWALAALGVALRLAQYLYNRSLWLDESWLTLNIMSRSFFDLLARLDYEQAAPFGFLALEKLAVEAAGAGEYALRFFPLLAGAASVIFFLGVARRACPGPAAAIALGLFVLSDRLIYYASEVKQYSSDALIALVVLAAALAYRRAERPGLAAAAGLALLGAASVWFSFPAVFVLGGIGATLWLSALSRKNWRRAAYLALAGAAWLASFAAYYLISLRYTERSAHLRGFWQDAFMPLPPTSLGDLRWFLHAFFDQLEYPLSPETAGLAGFLLVVGLISLFRRDRELGFLVVSPIALALLASGLERYPFDGRLTLFLAPLFMLAIGEGGGWLIARLRNVAGPSFPKSTSPAESDQRAGAAQPAFSFNGGSAVAAALLLVLFVPLALKDAARLVNPREKEEVRPLVQYLKENYREGDAVYVHWVTDPTFRYYRERLDAGDIGYIAGVFDARYITGTPWPLRWRHYRRDLERLDGRERVWAIFTDIPDVSREDAEFYRYALDSMGRQIEMIRETGAVLYLYDLSADPQPAEWANYRRR